MSVQTVVLTLNGQNYNLAYNSSTGKYEAQITAPSVSSWSETDHKYGLSVAATDDAGNITTVDRDDATFGSDLALRVLEKTAPVITPTYPTAGARVTTAAPKIQWTVTDEGSGINESTIALKLDGSVIPAASIIKTAIANGYSCSYTPTSLDNGAHAALFDVSDNDGNAATQASLSFTVDTIAPSLSLTAPAEGFVTNLSSLHVIGVTNDDTSNPVVVTVKVNGVDQGEVTLDGSGNFDKVVTLTQKDNVIEVTATDQAGLATTLTRNVTLDQSAPVFTSISVVPNPVDAGATFIISVGVTDA